MKDSRVYIFFYFLEYLLLWLNLYKDSTDKEVQKTLLISWYTELKLYKLNLMEKEIAGKIY